MGFDRQNGTYCSSLQEQLGHYGQLVIAPATAFYDVRIPGLPMTVVQADGQNVQPVETDELRIGVAETCDVIVSLPDDKAYTRFAESMDRSGYARGTIAPRLGMAAEIPQQRRRGPRGRLASSPYHRPPTRQFDLHLTGNWGFDGKKWSDSEMSASRTANVCAST